MLDKREGEMMNRKWFKKVLIAVLVVLIIGGCQPAVVTAKPCVYADIDKWMWADSLRMGSADGYVENNCSESVHYAIVRVDCYHASGALISVQDAVVWDIAPGAKGDFGRVFFVAEEAGTIDRCDVEVKEAEY